MAMESCRDASTNGSVRISDTVKVGEELDVEFLNDFDSYVEDIKARLTISKLVSDSVIRGMVNAVQQEADDKIAQKELELVRLKKMMNSYHVSSNENKASKSLLQHYEPTIEKDGEFSRLLDAFFEHGRIRESLGSLKIAAKGQFKNLRMEIDKIRRHSSVGRINSGSEVVRVGGILEEDETKDRIDVEKTLDSLKITLDSIYERVDDIIYSSRVSLCQWQLEREYQDDVEHMVVTNCIRSLKEQFEKRLWDQNAQCYDDGNVNWTEKINEISSLRQELDAISRSLSNPGAGMLNSHSSLEISDDLRNNKRTDHIHRKVSENHVLSLREGNGKHEESAIAAPENLEAAQLMRMSKEDLVNYFKTEMTKMKRNHDYKLHEMTEECFSLKREYLKERGSSLPFKKDKEFDVLRKKILDVVVKLDKILAGNEKFSLLSDKGETRGILKDKLECLVSENHQLRGILSNKEKEVNCLSSQISDALAKIVQCSLTEGNLLKKVENLESAVEDAHIESTISGDVYKYFIRESISHIKRISEDLEMEHSIMKEIYDLIYRDAFCNMTHADKSEFEDSDLESLIMEGICAIVFREAFLEAKETLYDLSKDACEKERVLKLEVEEQKKFQQHMLLMASTIDEKEKLLNEAAATMAREKDKFILVSQELDVVRDQANQLQVEISRCNEERNVLNINLHRALKIFEVQQVERCKLNQKLDQAEKDLRESDDEKRRLLAVAKEKDNILSLFEEKENQQRKQMELIITLVEGLSKAFAVFECRVAEDMKRSNLRLENLRSQSSSLIKTANLLKRKGLDYKQTLERRSSDLEKAETEVDLLGDQVDVLLDLLQKINIALDHYSPILKHYTGIMEILKLVRRELSGESTKLVRRELSGESTRPV